MTWREILLRRALLALALVFVGLGSLGAVLPLLPTTPFLLLAAACASRASPTLHAWLYSHRHFGPLLRSWRDHRAIPRRAKITGVVLIAMSWTYMWLTLPSLNLRLMLSAMMVIGIIFLTTRPSGPRPGSQNPPSAPGHRGENE